MQNSVYCFFIIISCVFFANVSAQQLEIDMKNAEASYWGNADWLTSPSRLKSNFKKLEPIERIELLQHDISESEIAFLSKLPSIKELKIGETPDYLSVPHRALIGLKQFESLEKLEIALADIIDDDLAFLPGMPKTLRSIHIQVPFYSTGLRNFGEARFSLSNECSKHIVQARQLEEVFIEGGNFSDRFIEAIVKLPNLKRLEVPQSW